MMHRDESQPHSFQVRSIKVNRWSYTLTL